MHILELMNFASLVEEQATPLPLASQILGRMYHHTVLLKVSTWLWLSNQVDMYSNKLKELLKEKNALDFLSISTTLTILSKQKVQPRQQPNLITSTISI
jgi:hypothetical protein